VTVSRHPTWALLQHPAIQALRILETAGFAGGVRLLHEHVYVLRLGASPGVEKDEGQGQRQ
jgi:hypothetical protein